MTISPLAPPPKGFIETCPACGRINRIEFTLDAKVGDTTSGFCQYCETWLAYRLTESGVALQPARLNTRKDFQCPHKGCRWEAWVKPDGILAKMYGATVVSIGATPLLRCMSCNGESRYMPP